MNALDKNPYTLRAIIKKNMIPFTIILSLGFLFYACNEKQNPLSINGETTVYQSESQLLNNINEPIAIADYNVTFSRTYDGDQTTFSYNVYNVNNVRPVANDFSLELLNCENVSDDYFPTDVSIDGNKIMWNQAIPASENQREYSITYEGNVTADGFANATIARGNLNETKTVPGPFCGDINIYTISGYVYVDADENKEKDVNESGIGNVTVEVLDGSDVIYSQRTSNLGFYEFTVIGGIYTVHVPENTDDESDFNEQLFELWNLTNDPTTYSFSPIIADQDYVNFGFVPDITEITSQFSSGEISLNTEDFRYWRKQLLLAINSFRAPGNDIRGQDIPAMNESTTKLLEYLEEIEGNFLLPNIFNFGSDSDLKRLQTAYNILQTPARTETQELCVELLATELNILSERGTGTLELDLAIAAFGEFFAAEGNHCLPSTNTGNGNMLMSNSVTETIPFTMTSSATTSSGTTLLRSFNGGGGGVGSK